MANKKTNIKTLYINSLNHIKNCKKFILTIIILFFFGFLVGLIISPPQEIIVKIIEMLKEILGQIEGKNTFEIIQFILFNNAKVSIIGLITGIFLGIIPIILALTNGYLLGFVALISMQSEGISSLWKILPHGIFELPAIFISLGLGLELGTLIFQKDTAKKLKEKLKKSLITFVLIVVPLLVIAAIIEGILIGFYI